MSKPRVKQGDLLGAFIWARGLTHGEVASSAGIARSHLSNIINGKDELTEELAEAIGKALGLIPSRLLRLEAENRRRHERKSLRRAQAGQSKNR